MEFIVPEFRVRIRVPAVDDTLDLGLILQVDRVSRRRKKGLIMNLSTTTVDHEPVNDGLSLSLQNEEMLFAREQRSVSVFFLRINKNKFLPRQFFRRCWSSLGVKSNQTITNLKRP